MDDFEILQEMLKTAATVPLTDNNGKYKAELLEPGANYSVTLSGLPADSVVIKVDTFPAPDTIFQGSRVNVDVPITSSLPTPARKK